MTERARRPTVGFTELQEIVGFPDYDRELARYGDADES